jgi:hypothetical protein
LISLSTLFMKRIGLTLSSRACLITVSVWVITPSTESTTTIAPSRTWSPFYLVVLGLLEVIDPMLILLGRL